MPFQYSYSKDERLFIKETLKSLKHTFDFDKKKKISTDEIFSYCTKSLSIKLSSKQEFLLTIELNGLIGIGWTNARGFRNDENDRIESLRKNNDHYEYYNSRSLKVSQKFIVNRRNSANIRDIKKEDLLSHLEYLKSKSFEKMYIRFADSNRLESGPHSEDLLFFVGGVKRNSEGLYLKENSGDFLNISGNESLVTNNDPRFSYYLDRKRAIYEFDTAKYSAFFECDSLGGVYHDLDLSISFIKGNFKAGDNIYFIPGYDSNPKITPGAYCSGNGISTVVLGVIPEIIRTTRRYSSFTSAKFNYADAGTGCCP